jgi:hypothetical protein
MPALTHIVERACSKTYFYFFKSLLIVVVVMYAFSFTVGKNLIDPAAAVPVGWCSSFFGRD